jgi:predicted metal-dependent peptidase
MYPRTLNFRIMLLSTDTEVQQAYRSRYGKSVDYIAFYAPKDKTVYISVDDIRLGVLAHELAHVVIEHYFLNSPPNKIHEVLAQFVETHLQD